MRPIHIAAAVTYGAVFGIAVSVAEQTGGDRARWSVIVAGILLFAVFVRALLRR